MPYIDEWPSYVFGVILGILLFCGIIFWGDRKQEEREKNPTTICVQGYEMIAVGRSWVYRLIDNKQIPCNIAK